MTLSCLISSVTQELLGDCPNEDPNDRLAELVAKGVDSADFKEAAAAEVRGLFEPEVFDSAVQLLFFFLPSSSVSSITCGVFVDEVAFEIFGFVGGGFEFLGSITGAFESRRVTLALLNKFVKVLPGQEFEGRLITPF